MNDYHDVADEAIQAVGFKSDVFVRLSRFLWFRRYSLTPEGHFWWRELERTVLTSYIMFEDTEEHRNFSAVCENFGINDERCIVIPKGYEEMFVEEYAAVVITNFTTQQPLLRSLTARFNVPEVL